jgi:hypothetical protein
MNETSLKQATNSEILRDRLPFLTIAIETIFANREKNHGYIRVSKKDNYYLLKLPLFPILVFYKNEDRNIYKVYWAWQADRSFDREHEEFTEKSSKPTILVRKKQRKVYDAKNPKLEKIQKIYEVVIKKELKDGYGSKDGILDINRAIANYIRDKIQENVVRELNYDIKPLAIVVEEN